jgi:hypothetical protein
LIDKNRILFPTKKTAADEAKTVEKIEKTAPNEPGRHTPLKTAAQWAVTVRTGAYIYLYLLANLADGKLGSQTNSDHDPAAQIRNFLQEFRTSFSLLLRRRGAKVIAVWRGRSSVGRASRSQ